MFVKTVGGVPACRPSPLAVITSFIAVVTFSGPASGNAARIGDTGPEAKETVTLAFSGVDALSPVNFVVNASGVGSVASEPSSSQEPSFKPGRIVDAFRDGSLPENLSYKVTGGTYSSNSGSGLFIEAEGFDKRGGAGLSLRYSRVDSGRAGLTPSTFVGPYLQPPDIYGIETTDTTGSVSSSQSQLMLMGTYNQPRELSDQWTFRWTAGAGLGMINNSASVDVRTHSTIEYVEDGELKTTISDSSSKYSLDQSVLAVGAMAKAEWEYRNRFIVSLGVEAGHGFGDSAPSSLGGAPAEAADKMPGMDPVGFFLGVGYRF